MNRYLRDKAMRRSGRDERNPYGSRGGYVRDKLDMAYDQRMRGRDRNMDDRNDYAKYDSRYDSRDYADYREQDYNYDYKQYRDYRRPMDYASTDIDKEYEEKLHEWIKKLKKKDRFASSKDDIIRKAKSMDVKFDKFTEDEFYAVYLMMVSDYKMVANDPHHYLAMAKEWLMDDDVEMQGSDKVCAYLYSIVLGETE